jgi:Zn-dependent protease with chaperone function/ribosome biogenesis GTPase A/uncharacterized small protein (DUF1192 family)
MATISKVSFQEFVKTREGMTNFQGESSGIHSYAYRSDHQMRRAFDRAMPVELAVTAAVRAFKDYSSTSLLGQSVKVGPNQFSRVHSLAKQCAATLGIVTPRVYIVNQATMNAMTFGTQEDSYILIHSSLIDFMTDEELLSVIGHECGHIHNKHVVYLTTLFLLKQATSIFSSFIVIPALHALNAWQRRAEITCDRAGLICVKDLNVSVRALAKLAIGSRKLYDQFNLDAFLDQEMEARTKPGRFAESLLTHPWIPKRILALRHFADSQLYRMHANIAENGLSMQEVDEQVYELIKITGLFMSLEQFHEKKVEVAVVLEQVGNVAKEIGASTAAHKLRHDVVKRLLEDRFHLVVMGEFNHGKSTFVNALLGKALLPAGITPTTAVLHHIEHSETPFARVVRRSGEKTDIDLATLESWEVDGAEASSAEADEISYIELGYPSKLLEERVVLVDTPGVNDLSQQRADITYNYVPRSDAILFLLDAGQILKESERVFLLDKLVGQSRDKIVFVVNKVDIWSEEEREEALEYVQKRLATLVKNPVMFPVSSLDALEGNLEGSGLVPLMDHLSEFLANERGRIILDHALGAGLNTTTLLSKGVEARRRASLMSIEELDRRIAIIQKDLESQSHSLEERRASIRAEIGAIKGWVHRDLHRMVDDVTKQIPAIVDEAGTSDLRKHLGSFLESTFVAWAEEETKEIASSLEKLAEKTIALVQEDARDTAKRLSASLAMQTPEIEVNTFAYDAGVVAMVAVGTGVGSLFAMALLGTLLGFVAAIPLAFYFRKKIATKTREHAKELAPKALQDAADQAWPRLEAMIDDFGERLEAWVVSASEEVHREILEVLSTVRQQHETSSHNHEEMMAALKVQSEQLAKSRDTLEEMRGALWEDQEEKPSEEVISREMESRASA